ncbi:transglutaminase family protein [uncultured Thiodictyon sp.]|uniref:transglutaminase family protein n=1 Tax=uncultured Thiodictyon sp. TaxID=1846217 RepID=UPI0025D841D8|nr:transglutaminase family protein [uncultured Thiodictyon sp.]
MKYRIECDFGIRFPTPVREHHCQIRLAPWEDGSQSLIRLELRVSPSAEPVARYDGFGNLAHHFGVLGVHRELGFTLTAEVETRLSNPFDFPVLDPSRERAWLLDSLHQAPRLWDFVYHQGRLTPKLPELIAERPTPVWQEGVPVLAQIQDAFAWVHGVAAFAPQAAESVTDLDTLFQAHQGTAADLTHLLIALLRGWGLPARFVSGYQDAAWFEPDDEAPAGTPPRPQTLHHWAEVLVPGAGWRGFDPAFGLLADDTYIRVAVGRDASDVSPLRHTCKGTGDPPELTETLKVTRLDQTPSA